MDADLNRDLKADLKADLEADFEADCEAGCEALETFEFGFSRDIWSLYSRRGAILSFNSDLP